MYVAIKCKFKSKSDALGRQQTRPTTSQSVFVLDEYGMRLKIYK